MNLVKLSIGQLAVTNFYKYPNRPTIIFLHDSLGCTQLWRDFPQKLAELTQCNFLVYDRLGYGESDNMPAHKRNHLYLENEADVLHELITTLKLDNVILFGHSDGASISLIMAGKYPNKIKAVISEAAHIFVEEETLQGVRDAVNAYQTTNLRERLIKYHSEEKVDNLFKAWTETWLMPEYKTWSIEKFLPQINSPVLVIQGDNDEYGTEKQVDGIVNGVKGKIIKLYLENVSHSPHKDQPQLILKHTAEFIKNFVEELV